MALTLGDDFGHFPLDYLQDNSSLLCDYFPAADLYPQDGAFGEFVMDMEAPEAAHTWPQQSAAEFVHSEPPPGDSRETEPFGDTEPTDWSSPAEPALFPNARFVDDKSEYIRAWMAEWVARNSPYSTAAPDRLLTAATEYSAGEATHSTNSTERAPLQNHQSRAEPFCYSTTEPFYSRTAETNRVAADPNRTGIVKAKRKARRQKLKSLMRGDSPSLPALTVKLKYAFSREQKQSVLRKADERAELKEVMHRISAENEVSRSQWGFIRPRKGQPNVSGSELMKMRMECACGAAISRRSIKVHCISDKHLAWIKSRTKADLQKYIVPLSAVAKRPESTTNLRNCWSGGQ